MKHTNRVRGQNTECSHVRTNGTWTLHRHLKTKHIYSVDTCKLQSRRFSLPSVTGINFNVKEQYVITLEHCSSPVIRGITVKLNLLFMSWTF